MNLKTLLNNIKNTAIPDKSKEWINNYAEECINYIKDEKDIKILGSEIKEIEMMEDNFLIIEVLMKISEKMKDSKYNGRIKGFLYQKIISQLELNKVDFLYLIVVTYASFDPEIIKVQKILDLTDSRWMYNYLLRYCINKDNNDLDKKYITKSFEIFRDNYKDYDYTPIMSKELREWIIKNKEYSETFANFILNNSDFFNKLIKKRKFEFENLKPFIISYPEYFWEILLIIVKIIFENRYYQLSYDIADDEFKECVKTVIWNAEIMRKFEILLSDNKNWIFDITIFILWAFIELGYFGILTNNNFYDHMLIEVYYILSSKINKKKFYEINKEIIDRNKKLNIEHKKKNEKYNDDKERKIRKEIDSLLSPNAIKKMEKQWKKLSSKIFKYFLENQNYFSNEQVEYIKKQVIDFLDSKKTNLKNQEINIIVKQETEQSRNLTYHNAWFAIDMFDCLRAARFLNIDLSDYKEKIISMLPYALTDEFQLILAIFNDIWVYSITWEDLNWLLNVYYNRICWDLYKISPCTIFNLIEKKLIVSKDITDIQLKTINKLYKNSLNDNSLNLWELESIINSMKKFEGIDRGLISKTYSELLNEFDSTNYYEDYLQNKFSIEETRNYEKMIALNDVLICNYKDKNAINRRFSQFDNISTNHPIINEEWEFFRWVSRIDDEFNLSDRFNRKLYEPLIENIHYPEYKDEYIKLFKLVDKSDFKGMVRPYLYSILKSYLKNAGNDILKICLDCDDNFFVVNYMKEYLTEEEIKKFNNLKKEELLMHLMDENNSLKRENYLLKKNLEKKWKINLYVEGKTDKRYIKKAMEVLWVNIKINIINCWWANNVFTNLAWVIDDRIWWIHIWLLDLDSWWVSSRTWNDINNRLFNTNKKIERSQKWYFWNKILENVINIWWKRNRYSLIFIPRVDEFKNQIFKEWKPYLWEINKKNASDFLQNMNIFNWSNLEDPIFETEHLIYNENVKEISNSFENINIPGWWVIKQIKNTQKNDLCKKIVNWNINLPFENWKNFEPLFKYIDEIQEKW